MKTILIALLVIALAVGLVLTSCSANNVLVCQTI